MAYTEVETNRVTRIRKRSGDEVDFDTAKISAVIFKAAMASGGTNRELADQLAGQVVARASEKFANAAPTVEDIQDLVEEILIKNGHDKTAKSFILYRAKRAELREQAAKSSREDDKETAALMNMFAHKSKLASLMGYDRIEAYKNMLFYLKEQQKAGKLPVHPEGNYLQGNELATNIYKKKYFLKDLTNELIETQPEQMFTRLAAFVAAVETTEEKQKEWAEKFYTELFQGHFLPGGRVIAGAGDLYRLKTLANCFVSVIANDDIESIYKAAYECARTYSYGGGIGVDISSLRPKGSIVHNAADNSTGAVSFMEIYSLTTGLIGQSGRRGALMLTVDVKHPDSPLFMKAKKDSNWVTSQIKEQCSWSGEFNENQLRIIEKQVRENTQVRFANISLKVTDEFMQAVEEQVRHGADKILVYKKDPEVNTLSAPQTGNVHYSYGIPERPIDKYEEVGVFDSLQAANAFLTSHNAQTIAEEEFDKEAKRDIFADYVVSGDAEYAVRRAGDYMLYYNTSNTGEIRQMVKARTLWNDFVEGNYQTAEPGLIFWSTMTKYSPSNYVGRPIASTNPCGEVPLEDGGACNLGSLNLSRFVKNGYGENAQVDWQGLDESARILTRFLDNVVIWNETLNALDKQRVAAGETRRLGLGVMGIADMLNQIGKGYDSDEGMEVIGRVMKEIADSSYQASADLAAEKGSSPIFDYDKYKEGAFFVESLSDETKEQIKQKGLRNIAVLSIAPTGTISNIILGYVSGNKYYVGVSGGVEPIFSLYYTRRSESFGNKLFKVFHNTVNAYIEEKGLKDAVEKCENEDELREILPAHFFRTAHHVDPERRVEIQGVCQKYVDHSISSTVNMAEDIEPEVISKIYLEAWKKGLKGITIYRDGSRYPILSVEGKKTQFQELKDKTFTIEMNGETMEVHGDSVLTMPDGSLTTVYHAIKNGVVSEQAGMLNMQKQEKEAVQEADIEAAGMQLSACPECGKQTLKLENGCHTCMDENCGFSKCDI